MEEPWDATLRAHGALTVSMTQTLSVPPGMLVGSSVNTRAALTRRFEFLGVDEAGMTVVIPVLVTFDPR